MTSRIYPERGFMGNMTNGSGEWDKTGRKELKRQREDNADYSPHRGTSRELSNRNLDLVSRK